MRALPLNYDPATAAVGPRSALENEAFPFEAVSDIAEQESWRKEVNRPIYHVHKWWAQRLGSVFRAVVIGALSPPEADVLERFYSPTRFPDATVFDPFMGSGTTVGEAIKLGCRAIGRDINPVAAFLVRNALEAHSREAIELAFANLANTVRHELAPYYRCVLPNGDPATVLYYFWTKVLPCPSCDQPVELMSKRIFAQHAYPKKYPTAQASCPSCGEINSVRYDDTSTCCGSCSFEYNPKAGPANGTKATCPTCQCEFPIAATAKKQGRPPSHKMYAKLVLTNRGDKVYLPINQFDLDLYEAATLELDATPGLYPIANIEPGYNTNQVLNYGYTQWHQMFNARQLLCLGMLGRAIKGIEQAEVRDALTCLFSGSLEFNNMFASYKGEGTGAVRHMFYHHILKPERTPLEANVWGTPKSSGSFSGMFRTRLLRALDYAENPFELASDKAKAFGLSDPIGECPSESFAELEMSGGRLYTSCGDSSLTDLADKCVDAIITDPPFFDNVNYSQLADFFHVWQRHVLGLNGPASTRSEQEVQHQEPNVFSARLAGVLQECNRVLKENGLLAFSYHHSRSEGWSSVIAALSVAGFVITASVPVKAEMSGAAPKNQAKEPIDLDIIIVCRKRLEFQCDLAFDVTEARRVAQLQVGRLRKSGRRLSRNDVRVVLMGQLLKAASQADEVHLTPPAEIELWIAEIHDVSQQS